MATKHLTSRVRRSRNATQAAANSPENPNPNQAWEALRDAIETERGRLMTAESVLHCVAIAMDDDDRDDLDTPHYPTLIELSRDLVKQAIDQLDSVRLKPMLEKVGVHGAYAVKESAVEYLH